MFAHFTQGSNDLPRAIRFYDALLAALNIKRRESADNERCNGSVSGREQITGG